VSQLPFIDIAEFAWDAGFRGEDHSIAIALTVPESGRRPTIENTHNPDGSIDTGLWQINSSHGFDREQLKDPAFNAECAFKVFKGQGWDAWVAFKRGLHEPSLDAAKVAMDAAARLRTADARVAQYRAERDRIRDLHVECQAAGDSLRARIAAAIAALA
jgi:hypothetical protein